MTPHFRFHHLQEVDLDNGIRIHMCGRSGPTDYGKKTYTFHIGCYSIAPASFSPPFALAMAYDYRPSYEDERQRARRIRDAAAAKALPSIPDHVPQDIVNLIMEYLVMEPATLYTQEIFSSLRYTAEFKYRLKLRRDIYVKYREIEGVNYVQWLSNKDMGGKGLLLYKAKRSRPFKTKRHERVPSLWVAFDHLGVRRVECGKPPSEVCIAVGSPPYWKEIKPDKGETFLVCIQDVSSS